MTTRRFKFSKKEKGKHGKELNFVGFHPSRVKYNLPVISPRDMARNMIKNYKPPIPTDELPEHLEKMAPIWKKMADRTGCPYCRKKVREGDVPRWKAWICPVCGRGRFLIPKDVKHIEDLY